MLIHSIKSTAKWRIRHNKNWIICVIGATGSGKSYGSLRLGEDIDKYFSIRNVCFTPREILKLINDHLSGARTLPKGSVIIVEEAGVQYSSRAWMSFNNKMLGAIAQSFRSMNWVIIFNLPNFSWFEKQARELTHLLLIANKIDYEKEKAYFDILELAVNNFTGKLIPFYPYLKLKKGGYRRIKRVMINKPSDKLVEEYEQKKMEFQVDKYQSLFKESGQRETKKRKKEATLEKQ